MTARRHSALHILSAAAMLTVWLPSAGHAQEADVTAVLDATHAAIHARDIDAMAKLWSHAVDVTLVNPRDTTVAVGWDAVKANWEQVFKALSGVDIKQTAGPFVAVTGKIARAVGIVHVTLHIGSDAPSEVDLVETNVLEKQAGGWRLLSHTAKPL